jgi:L-2-hydroxyglutarate oxidase
VTEVFDAIVVGAGIVGAATAAELCRRHPGWRVAVLEKERAPAQHQTGRNSGVIHSGVYYKPGSLKARLCVEGLDRTYAFARDRNVPVDRRGKLLVATDAPDADRLDRLEETAARNGVAVERLSGPDIRRLEPRVAGVSALRVPATGIVDYAAITRALLADVETAGGRVLMGARVERIDVDDRSVKVRASGRGFETGILIGCAGLASDRLARLAGIDPGLRIVPFRGEYFTLPRGRGRFVHHLIYPVPNPALPFLGVHLTPMIDGSITVGPNAVLSLARERYDKLSFELRDAASALGYAGTWRAIARHPGATWNEMRGWLSRRRFLAEAQKYCPDLTLADLGVYRSGNRAQAIRPDGALVDDFLIETRGPVAMVLNAPSPAATSAMPIAAELVNRVIG